MIIKLIPVKRLAAIGGILEYISSDKGHISDYKKVGYFHNVQEIELDALAQEFRDNYFRYAKPRAAGNKFLHIVLSISPIDHDAMKQSTMDSIVHEYLEKAYPAAIAFGATHHNPSQKHWHAHLVVSANQVRSPKSTRLDKATLKAVHAHMLDYVRTHHKELRTTIDLANWGKKHHSEKEYYKRKRHPQLTLTKDELSRMVQHLFRSAESSKDFYRKLEKASLATYTHKSQVFGIRWGEDYKKMRFSRLGINQEQIALLDKQNDRLKQLEQIRQEDRSQELEQAQER